MPITETEKICIENLLVKEEQNIHILFKLANSVTGNVVDIASTQEALDFICTHTRDLATLLNKRNITKEVLFKYLHCKKVAVTSDFTKATLVSKVIEFWNKSHIKPETATEPTPAAPLSESATGPIQNVQLSSQTHNSYQFTESLYPIHLLAHKFSEWFFENYNKEVLKEEDFWSDVRLLLRIAASDRIDEQECTGATAVVSTLMNCKHQFKFYFNPNLTHSGVQGRMDVHGLVLVLVCGTLHTQLNCVGVFECIFGLMRDPFTENNWKMKTTQMMLRSEGAPDAPSLCDSQTLRDALALPIPMGELS